MNTPIEVTLNETPSTLPPGSTVRQLISEHTGKELDAAGRALDGSRLGVAVAINGQVIARSAWAEHPVPAGARIDLVTAAQGG